MKTIDFLQKYPSFEEGLKALEEEFGIVSKVYEHYAILNYSQIDSPKFDPIVKECRGLILDRYSYSPLRRMFNRFYNYGEGQETLEFNFSKSKCYEKLDGSIIGIWYDPFICSWQAGTRGTACGEAPVNEFMTFLELVQYTLHCTVDDFMEERSRFYTYIFELTTPKNRIVTPYSDYRLSLLGVVNNTTGKEIGEFQRMNVLEGFRDIVGDVVKAPIKYNINSIDKAHKFIEENLQSMEEGFVFHDEESGIRIKVKNPLYLAIHNLRNNGSLSAKRIMYLVQQNEYDEYLSYYPEDEVHFIPYLYALRELSSSLNAIYIAASKVAVDRKDFARIVIQHPGSDILFRMYSMSDPDSKNILREKDPEHLLKMVHPYLEEL